RDPKCTTHWQLNETLLDDPRVMDDLRQTIGNFTDNDTGEVSHQWVWEAHKGTARGTLIKWGSRLKKERTQHINSLTTEIHLAEALHKQDPTAENFQKLTALRIEMRSLLALKAHRSVQLTRGSFYTQDDIATAFSTFYEDLYNLDTPSQQPNNLREYITSNLSHTIPDDTALTLDEPFSPAELSLAIKTLPK
ncbi:Hypothetical predicted protein, partial [Pelobates cultripes]